MIYLLVRHAQWGYTNHKVYFVKCNYRVVRHLRLLALHDSNRLLIQKIVHYLLRTCTMNTRVKPGFIRVDADEVTYPAHVILL